VAVEAPGGLAAGGIFVRGTKGVRIERNAIVRNDLRGLWAAESEGTSVVSNLVEGTRALAGLADDAAGIVIWDGTADIRGTAVFTGAGFG
jgi:parallel beta-helix repeat protein